MSATVYLKCIAFVGFEFISSMNDHFDNIFTACFSRHRT